MGLKREGKKRKKERERQWGNFLTNSSLFTKGHPFRILVNHGFIMTTINQCSYGLDYHSLERIRQCFFHTITNSTLAQKSETQSYVGFCPSAIPGANSIYNSALLRETSFNSTDFKRISHSFYQSSKKSLPGLLNPTLYF